MDAKNQIQIIKSQIMNIKLSIDNMDLMMNNTQIGELLINLSIQMLNTGIQTFNLGKDNFEMIDYNTFSECPNLTTINIPGNTTFIGVGPPVSLIYSLHDIGPMRFGWIDWTRTSNYRFHRPGFYLLNY